MRLENGSAWPQIVPVVDEGLGNSSYVVGLGDGSALVVDAARDPAPYLAVARDRGWRLRFALETHLHADFVSGSRQLTAAGATVVASAGAPLAYPAKHLADGDELDTGGLVFRAIATPGHTPEHVAYLAMDGDVALAVFTGGTLIVGGVARPDLLGDSQTVPLARAAYRSIHDRLLTLPDDVPLYPTHGAGSFCSTGGGRRRTTTIGDERANNPLLQIADEDTFVAQLLGGLGTYPPYFLELRDVNRAGPVVYDSDGPPLTALDVERVDSAVAAGAEVIDVRDIVAFAAGHVPGSLSIPMRDQFGPWLGWLVDRNRPLVIVADDSVDRRRLVWAALTVGYDRIVGELGGGVAAWTAAGRRLREVALVDGARVDAKRRIVDVRQRSEWEAGHVPGATHIELGALPRELSRVGDSPVLVHCGHGERAMTAASVLLRSDHDDVAVLTGGPEDLLATAAEPARR